MTRKIRVGQTFEREMPKPYTISVFPAKLRIGKKDEDVFSIKGMRGGFILKGYGKTPNSVRLKKVTNISAIANIKSLKRYRK